MFKNINFKALTIGIIIFLLGSFILGLLLFYLIFLLLEQFNSELEMIDFLSDQSELIVSYLVSWAFGFYASYYTVIRTINKPVDHGIILGVLLLMYHLIGTALDLFDPKGDPFILNISYDVSVFICFVLGSKYAKERYEKGQLNSSV